MTTRTLNNRNNLKALLAFAPSLVLNVADLVTDLLLVYDNRARLHRVEFALYLAFSLVGCVIFFGALWRIVRSKIHGQRNGKIYSKGYSKIALNIFEDFPCLVLVALMINSGLINKTFTVQASVVTSLMSLTYNAYYGAILVWYSMMPPAVKQAIKWRPWACQCDVAEPRAGNHRPDYVPDVEIGQGQTVSTECLAGVSACAICCEADWSNTQLASSAGSLLRYFIVVTFLVIAPAVAVLVLFAIFDF